jgi:ATP-dependent Lon protease
MVLIPKENEKDIEEIPAPILKGVTLMMVEHMDDVLRNALVLADPDAFFAQKPVPPTPTPRFEAEEKAELGEDEDEPTVSPNPNLS